jgi:hypothetical protein
VSFRFADDRRADQFAGKHGIHLGIPVREVGPNRHLALAAEMDPQDARQLAQRLLLSQPTLQKIAQRYGGVITDEHVAAVQQNGQ